MAGDDIGLQASCLFTKNGDPSSLLRDVYDKLHVAQYFITPTGISARNIYSGCTGLAKSSIDWLSKCAVYNDLDHFAYMPF